MGKRKRKSLWLHPPKRCKMATRATDPDWTSRMNTYGEYRDQDLNDHMFSTRATDQIWTPTENRDTVCPESEELKVAPSKISTRIAPPKSKKALFENDELEVLRKEMIDILPSMLNNLDKANKLVEFCQLLRLIASGMFPLSNISFLLLLDVARWYSLKNTSQMTYPNESMVFWKTMYRLFHGKTLRFMSGEKSSGQVLTGESNRGSFTPDKTSINFAVPNINVVISFENNGTKIPKEMDPGVIEQGIELRSKDKTYVLSVDGKKLAPGLTKSNGDQDLFGHEQNETLTMIKDRLAKEINEMNDVSNKWNEMNIDEKCTKLQVIVKITSVRIKDMRNLFLKQSFALKRFHKEAGENWRESKFVYAISSVQAQIYQIRTVVKKLLQVNDMILKSGSILKMTPKVSATYSSDCAIDISAQENCVRLKDVEELSFADMDNPRFIKQRSEEWFDNRKNYKVTGSTLYAALGLDTLKKQQKHFDRVVKGIEIQETFSEEVQMRLEHGTKSEINAIATLVSKFLPFYLADMKYIEEGAFTIGVNGEPLMMVSPDGSLCTIEPNTDCIPSPALCCEFKCPVDALYKTPVHYEVPLRYIPQVLAEMASMGVDALIYLCWTEESSTVFRVTFDSNVWNVMLEEVKRVFHGPDLKRPTKLSAASKELVDQLKEYRATFTEFICEIPSVKGTYSGLSQSNDKSPYLFPITTLREETMDIEIEMIMNTATSAVLETHEICRKKATEVLVWLLSDTNRTWDPEVPHSTPVGYAMIGYSLPVTPMRDMHEHILQSCYEKGMDVVCSCFDGQWIKLATRDVNDKPLTLLQLQRDVYEQAAKINRKYIVRDLKEKKLLEDLDQDIMCVRRNESITVSCKSFNRVMLTIRKSFEEECKRKKEKEEKTKFESDTISCLPTDALETLMTEELCVTDEVTGVSETVDETSYDVNQQIDPLSSNDLITKQILRDEELINVLGEFQTSKQKSINKRWTGKTIIDLQTCISHINKLKCLTHSELNILIDASMPYQKTKGIQIRRSWTSLEKVNAISKVIGSTDQIIVEKTVKKLKSLKTFAAEVVEKSRKCIPKVNLNNVYAATIYDSAYKVWLDMAPFKEEMHIQGVGASTLFSYPERNGTRQKLEHRCVDYHHLFVNLRVKVCKDGLKGIRKEAWQAVAEADDAVISKAIIFDLIDKQNNAYAKRTFSRQVETAMRTLNFHKEANFCKLIRQWYQAEDMPGLSANERNKRRLALKNFLLDGVDFGQYPVPGMYVKGFPKVMYEAFLQRIDTSFQLYSSIKGNCYNPRAISSLVNETFFGELSEMEPTKLGCPKAVDVPRLISVVTEIQHFRCDPTSRNFKIITTRKSVYPTTELQIASDNSTTRTSTYDGDESELRVRYVLYRNTVESCK